MAAALCVGSIEIKAIYDIFDDQEDFPEGKQPSQNNFPKEADHDLSVLAGFSPLLDEREMFQRLSYRGEIGRFKCAIGSTDALHTDCLDDDTASMTDSDSEYLFGQEELCEERNSEQEMVDANTDIVDKILAGEIDPDEIFTCDAFAKLGTPRNGVTAEKLSKVWRISLKDAKRDIDVTSQH